MLRSTFLGYKTATSALKVNQNVLDVIGQNISNINTKGYTRQRLDINSVSFNTTNMRFSVGGIIIGQGVGATGVSQYRDSFLDLRYRMAAAKTGSQDVQLEALKDLEMVFDEITMDGLDAQFSNLLEQFHSLTSSPSDPVLEGVVRTSAQILAQMFNDYSRQIDTIRNQQISYLKDGAIVKVNQLLENIAKLNKEIKESNIGGNPALELNDERNMLIDELANYVDITVDDTELLDIGDNKYVNLLKIKLSGSETYLVKDGEFSELAFNDSGDNGVFISIDGTNINSQIKGGQLEGYLKFINGKGAFANDGEDDFAKSQGVLFYKNMLNTLADKFATEMNKLNYPDKPLFSKRDDGDTFTAGNIKISDEWAKSTDSYIKNTNIESPGDNSAATDNILKMINAFQTDHDFNSIFKGTFQEFLAFTTTRLNLQVSDVETSYDTYLETQYQIDYARSSMSSVDLNEEGVNLLQYSKSYNAAAKLMTTLDEMLDTLINRMI